MALKIIFSTIGFLVYTNICHAACPTIPSDLPGQPVQDLNQGTGMWYEYLYRNGPKETSPGSNVVHNGTALGMFASPISKLIASYYITLYDGTGACMGMFQFGNFTYDGKRQMWNSFGEEEPALFNYITLYTDNNLVEVVYRCNVFNADGKTCDDPYFWVNTRVPAPQLTTYQKTYIQQAADYYLAQICRSTSDMFYRNWDLTTARPMCNVAAGNPLIPGKMATLIDQALGGVNMYSADISQPILVSAFQKSLLIPDIIDKAPKNQLMVTFPNNAKVMLGNELTPTAVKVQPTVSWPTDPGQYYTLMELDPDAPSTTNSSMRSYVHWLVYNIIGNDLSSGTVWAEYQGSLPPANSGLHRYSLLVLGQPGKIAVPPVSTGAPEKMRFSVRDFSTRYGLSQPVAGNFYRAGADAYSSAFYP